MKEVISEEQAEMELSSFCDELELDLDGAIAEEEQENSEKRASGWTDEDGQGPPPEGKSDTAQVKAEILKLMKRGRLTIEGEKIRLTLTAPTGANKELLFEEPDGSGIASIRKKKSGSSPGDLFPLISSMTHKTPPYIGGLKKRDLMPCFMIARLFLTQSA